MAVYGTARHQQRGQRGQTDHHQPGLEAAVHRDVHRRPRRHCDLRVHRHFHRPDPAGRGLQSGPGDPRSTTYSARHGKTVAGAESMPVASPPADAPTAQSCRTCRATIPPRIGARKLRRTRTASRLGRTTFDGSRGFDHSLGRESLCRIDHSASGLSARSTCSRITCSMHRADDHRQDLDLKIRPLRSQHRKMNRVGSPSGEFQSIPVRDRPKTITGLSDLAESGVRDGDALFQSRAHLILSLEHRRIDVWTLIHVILCGGQFRQFLQGLVPRRRLQIADDRSLGEVLQQAHRFTSGERITQPRARG